MGNYFEGKEICFLAGTLGQGGAERQLFYMIKALLTHHARVRVLCLTSGEYWENRLCAAGVPVTYVGRRPSLTARTGAILRQLWLHRPDILHSQHFYTNAYAVAAGRILGIRHVGSIRSNFVTEINGELAWARRASVRLLDRIAVNSQAALRSAADFGVPNSKLRFLPNVIDTEEFCPLNKPTHGDWNIISVGRLVPSKRFDRFIDTIAQVRAKTDACVKGVVVGSGPLELELKKRAKALGLNDGAIEFRAAASADMAAIYQRASLLLLTSDYEGTPNVVLEAMSCGVPVIAGAISGLTDLIQSGTTGVLVSPTDTNGYSDAVLRLMQSHEIREDIRRNARTYIQAHHSLSQLASDLEAVYTK
jgi:glycosyltransferase involved in cell wall biosynthesis